MTGLRKGLWVGVVTLGSFAGGCGYPCPARCDAMKEVIAELGFNPDNASGSGGYDPDTVCDLESIRSATTCVECETAIREAYRLWSPRLACDCPTESWAADEPEANRIVYFDQMCVQQDLAFSAESCVRWQSEKSDDPESCLEG